MCLYPKRIINKKYVINDKNGGNVPLPPVIGTDDLGNAIYDERVLRVQVGCGQCIECRKQKARNWQVRLNDEIKQHKYNYFVTLTFSPKGLQEVCNKGRLQECNAAAEYALRHSLERYRKAYKHSLKHWFITELGHVGTERIHMHGIILADEELQFNKTEDVPGKGIMAEWKYWKYGHVFVGTYVNTRSVNYVVKYMHKIDQDHKGFIGQVLCSPGIGRSYTDKIWNHELHKYRPGKTIDYYRLPNGSKIKLPTYYKYKFVNEDERELIWREFMDKDKVSILGQNYEAKTAGNTVISNIVEKAQESNIELGYGNDSKEYRKRNYNVTKRMLQEQERKRQMDKMAITIRLNNYNIAKKMQKNLEE